MEVWNVLSFFPKPYPDELLYSIIARYHIWSGNNEISDTMEQLFDNRRERATVLIPKHLKHLAEKTKKFGLDFEALLYEHTVYPFVTCFLSKASFNNVFSKVKGSNQKEIGFNVYRHYLCPRYLNYCPLCLRDDRNKYGEAYWHRMHQSFGITMCCKHNCRLVESEIEILDSRNNRYIALELLSGLNCDSKPGDLSRSGIELQIAKDVEYIYQNHEFIRNILWEKHSEQREATIALLFNRNLATKKGLVKIDRLIHEFQSRYNSDQMKLLMDEMNNNKKCNWLISLCRGSSNAVVPIRYLLFADFIIGSLESYIKMINEQQQFIDRGKEAFQPPIRFEEKLVQYRNRWLEAREKQPNCCRFDLVKADHPAYTWLRRHDNEWMINNSPPAKKPHGTIIFKDWDKIDKQLEVMVQDAVIHIKDIKGKPERITKANILRHMEQENIIERNYKLLPCTINTIEQYIESTYDYQIRKIDWAIDELKREENPAIPWLTLRKAGIRDKDWYKFRHLFTS